MMTPAQYLLLGSTTASAGLAVGLILNLAFIINDCENEICKNDMSIQRHERTEHVHSLRSNISGCRAEIAELLQLNP